MNFFSQLITQLGKLISSQTAARRLVILAVLAGSIAGLVYLMTRARVGTYKTLYSNLQPADAAAAAGKLHQLDIPTRFAENGAVLQVPSGKWDQALMVLAQEGFPESGAPGYDELMGKSSIGRSEFEVKVMYHRSLEGELARTIMTIRGIERARVHLALPKPSLFVRDAPKPTASVVLKLRPGNTLAEKEVKGIALLVSRAIEGLDADSVSIIDNRGMLLNKPSKSGDQASIGDRVAYKVDYENLLKDRIESMLAKTVGEGKVVARVNADFNFAQRTLTEETFDPESQVARRENVKGEGPLSPSAGAGAGPAGSDSNLPPGNKGETAAGSSAKDPRSKLDRETLYELSKKTSQTVETVPTLLRQTVSVLVDGRYDEVDDGKGNKKREFVPRDAKEIATLEETVKSVIGFSEDRGAGTGDVLTVKSLAFQLGELEGESGAPKEPRLSPDLIRELIQWGMVGAIGLLLIFMVLRPAVRSVTLIPSPAGLPPGAAGSKGGAAASRGLLAEGAPRGGALPESGGGLGRRIGDSESALPGSGALTFELGKAALQDVPKAARIIRQWMEEGQEKQG